MISLHKLRRYCHKVGIIVFITHSAIELCQFQSDSIIFAEVNLFEYINQFLVGLHCKQRRLA